MAIGLGVMAGMALASPAAAGEVLLVPSEYSLENALLAVNHGDVIEIEAGAVLTAPNGGWQATESDRSYSIRAAAAGVATLDGGDATEIMTIRVTEGFTVTLQDLVFANGFSVTADTGSGVTVREGRATFVRCSFTNNAGEPPADDTSVGALRVVESTAYLVDCTFVGNTARTSGGGLAVQNGTVWAHRCLFSGNRADVPNHRSSAAGGAIHVGNGFVRLTNSRFEGNRAGYVGGAVFVIGDFSESGNDPSAEVTAANCTFDGNVAAPDDSVTLTVPTEGGGFHVENQATGRIYASRFYSNVAENGGGINSYRGIVEVTDSILVGNRSSDGVSAYGRGGGISAISNDTANSTTNFGAINRRPSSVSVVRTAIIGNGDQDPLAQTGGGVLVTGDINRIEGSGGVDQMGTVAQNRADLTLDGVLLAGLRSTVFDNSSAKGGGISTRAADLTMNDSMVVGCVARGDDKYSQGGGLMLNQYSLATMTSSVVAGNISDNTSNRDFCGGAGVSMFGAELHASEMVFAFNELSPGHVESIGSSNGAALYSSPDANKGLDIDGSIASSLFVSSAGLAIWEFDYDSGPINDLRFNSNEFWESSFGDRVFKNKLAGGGVFHTPDELNSHVVVRSGAANTVKSSSPNSDLQATPVFGHLLVSPEIVLTEGAVGDPESAGTSYLGWTWSGTAADLNGQSLSSNTGYMTVGAGNHVLDVDGQPVTATVASIQPPSVDATVVPESIDSGESATLSWSSSTSSFLEISIDNAEGYTVAPSGSINVAPTVTTTYRVFLLTGHGGAVGEVTLYVDEQPPVPTQIFIDGFESGLVDAWSSSS
jgi:hypothetical protein